MIAQQRTPARLAALPALQIGNQKEEVIALRCRRDHLFNGNILIERFAKQCRYLLTRNGRVGMLVTRHEKVAALFALGEAIGVGVLRQRIEREFVTFLSCTATATFQIAASEPLIHQLSGRFKLPDLKRSAI